MTSQHTADYPTLQEVLRLPVFAGCTVCGGAAGLGRRVSGVNLTDTPDYARWLAQGELLITTGFAIADDPQAVDALLPTAAEKGLSGVGIKPGRYLPSPLPAVLAEKADRLGLPLLQLPTDMRFAELADAVSRMAARSEAPCVTDDPAGVVRLLEESSPAETEAIYTAAVGNAPAAARAAAARAAGHAGELAALYGQPAPDGAGAAPALQHRELPAPAVMVAAGGRSGRSDEAIGIGNGPVSVPVQAHIKE